MKIETSRTIDVSETNFCILLLKDCPKEKKDCKNCGLYKRRAWGQMTSDFTLGKSYGMSITRSYL